MMIGEFLPIYYRAFMQIYTDQPTIKLVYENPIDYAVYNSNEGTWKVFFKTEFTANYKIHMIEAVNRLIDGNALYKATKSSYEN